MEGDVDKSLRPLQHKKQGHKDAQDAHKEQGIKIELRLVCAFCASSWPKIASEYS